MHVFGGYRVGHGLRVALRRLDQQVAVVERHGAEVREVQHRGQRALFLAARRHEHVGRCEQVAVDVLRPAFGRLGLDVRIRVEGRLLLVPAEADDDDVHVRVVGGLGVPHERAVREPDVPSPFPDMAEQGRDLLALGDAVRGHERELGRLIVLEVVDGPVVPAGHVVEASAGLAAHEFHILLDLLRALLVSDERRVAHHIVAVVAG